MGVVIYRAVASWPPSSARFQAAAAPADLRLPCRFVRLRIVTQGERAVASDAVPHVNSPCQRGSALRQSTAYLAAMTRPP